LLLLLLHLCKIAEISRYSRGEWVGGSNYFP